MEKMTSDTKDLKSNNENVLKTHPLDALQYALKYQYRSDVKVIERIMQEIGPLPGDKKDPYAVLIFKNITNIGCDVTKCILVSDRLACVECPSHRFRINLINYNQKKRR